MTDEKKSEKVTAKAPLGPAGESSDPAVQDLLAQRAGAELNRSALEVDEDVVKAADAEIARIDKALKDLGVTI